MFLSLRCFIEVFLMNLSTIFNPEGVSNHAFFIAKNQITSK